MSRSSRHRVLPDRQLVSRLRRHETAAVALRPVAVFVLAVGIISGLEPYRAGAAALLVMLARWWNLEHAHELLDVARRRGVARGVRAALEADES